MGATSHQKTPNCWRGLQPVPTGAVPLLLAAAPPLHPFPCMRFPVNAGIINEAAKLFVLDSYGQEVWDKIVETTGVDPHFISGCPYADEQTYK